MEGTKVFIKSIPRPTATKVSEFRDKTSGKKLNRTKIGRCNDKLRAVYSMKTGTLLTGLDEFIDNPYYKSQKDLPSEFEYLRNTERCTRQEILEVKHGRPKGYYTNRAWTSADGLKDEDLTFFQKFRYAMNDGTTVLDLSKPLDEIAYYMLKANPLIAMSNRPEDRSIKPFAEFYISDKHESMQEKFSKKTEYNKAIGKLDSPDFTPSYQRKVAKVLKLVKGDVASMRDEQIYLILDQFIEEGLKGKEHNISDFMEVCKLMDTPDGRAELEAHVFIEDLLAYRVISENKETYKWLNKDMILGYRRAEVIDFLLDPKKQPERDELERQLKAKLIK